MAIHPLYNKPVICSHGKFNIMHISTSLIASVQYNLLLRVSLFNCEAVLIHQLIPITSALFLCSTAANNTPHLLQMFDIKAAMKLTHAFQWQLHAALAGVTKM